MTGVSIFRSAEQENFAAIVRQHMARPDAPLLLEGGTGLGKTRAYLSALAASNQRIAIALPSHTLIEQLMASSDLAAAQLGVEVFRPARMCQTRREYEEQKRIARDARVMLCTAASVIIDHRIGGEYNGATKHDYIVFDEADQLPDMAALQSDIAITKKDMAEAGIKFTDTKDTLKRIANAPPRVVEPEMRAAAKVMLEVLSDEPRWFQNIGLDDDGAISLTHRLPGRLLRKVSNRSEVAFISATLTVGGKFDNFRNAMGIDRISDLSRAIEPELHGTLDFQIHEHAVGTDEWFAAIIAAIKKAKPPVLVATTSHDLTARLRAAIGPLDGVTIRAGAWAGLDLAERPRTIIVPAVPYSAPQIIDGEVISHYLDAKVTALRRMRQVIGRGLRTPDAVCSVVVLDVRAQKLGQFVPDRFVRDWASRRIFDEGERNDFQLSKIERDPALRKVALKHYGCRCRWSEGCEVADPHMLDVHHLDPIAEGSRKTTLADVTVLCANHHRKTHRLM